MEKVGELTVTGGQKALLKGVDAMLEESNRVVSVADRAYKLKRTKDGTQKPEGMSDEDFHIACDAMQPNKDCPTYLREHYERLKLQMRIAGGHGDSGAPLITFIQNNFNAPKYETIDVTPVEK
jgi:hypothetical protein